MDHVFARMLDKHVTPVNPVVVGGIAGHFMQYAETYLEGVFRDLSRGFPPELQYDCFERMSPEEMLYETTRAKAGGRRSVDISASDTYMIRVKLNWLGEPLLQLPVLLVFTDRHGVFRISGRKRHVVPFLNHRVISPSASSIFVRVSKAKTTFRKLFHSIAINGVATAVDVPYGNIHQSKGSANDKNLVVSNAETLITHYLLAKYGFAEAFRRFIGAVPIVGTSEITPELYPPETHTIVGFCGLRPATALGGASYRPTEIRMAIRNEDWTPAMRNMVAGTYYVIDHFPNEIAANELDDTYRWIVFLGYILQSMSYVQGKLYRDMQAHLTSLDEHLDMVQRDKLAAGGVMVNDFYELLAYVNNNFEQLIQVGIKEGTSVYNKTIDVLQDMYEPIVHGFNSIGFEVTKMLAKQDAKAIDKNNLRTMLRGKLTTGRIYLVTKSQSTVTEAVDCCNPFQYLKIAAKLQIQEANPVRQDGGRQRVVVNASSRLDPSAVDLGSVLFLPKKKPDPIKRLNPYANIGPDGSVLRNPLVQPIVEALNKHYRCGDDQILADADSMDRVSLRDLE